MQAIALDKAHRSIALAQNQYERLVMLAGPTGSGKTTVLRAIAEANGAPVINVSLQLSELLLEVPVNQRAKQVHQKMQEFVGLGKSLLILDNLEILFAKELRQDPLRLLKALSKERLVVAAWPGRIEGQKLIYAKPGHPEFQSYELLDLLWVEMDGRAAIDLLNI